MHNNQPSEDGDPVGACRGAVNGILIVLAFAAIVVAVLFWRGVL